MKRSRWLGHTPHRTPVIIALYAGAFAAGQVDYGWTEFSIGAGTSPALGRGDGGNAFGSNGWFFERSVPGVAPW